MRKLISLISVLCLFAADPSIHVQNDKNVKARLAGFSLLFCDRLQFYRVSVRILQKAGIDRIERVFLREPGEGAAPFQFFVSVIDFFL